jgi:steroid delta-isomerase-like uncharacterized protein
MSQSLIDTAKASIVAYNDKNWDAVSRALASDIAYDEVATHRTLTGASDVIEAWKGWASAIPDSRASFEAAYVSGNTVVLEITWRGAQSGPLQMPTGTIPATGKRIEIRAVQVVELTPDGKTRRIRHYFDMATMLSQLGVNAVGA